MTNTTKGLERTMESDASEAIRYCVKMKFTKLVVRFSPKKGWSVSQRYCCKKHTPELMLNSERKKL